ncbi:hypothetical protein [Bacillus weihaiensis]|uniref:hypothetical protein n=1 Tax=Bacillus weihaiensis TaxID=1547283 RepID=UPI0011AB477B|nr:hypothetical protein [Bacillus weihaiensis]
MNFRFVLCFLCFTLEFHVLPVTSHVLSAIMDDLSAILHALSAIMGALSAILHALSAIRVSTTNFALSLFRSCKFLISLFHTDLIHFRSPFLIFCRKKGLVKSTSDKI